MGGNLSNAKPLALFSRSLPALNRGLPVSIPYPSSLMFRATGPSLPGSELASPAPAGLSSSTTLPPRPFSERSGKGEATEKAPGGRDDDKRDTGPVREPLRFATRTPFPPQSCPVLEIAICPPVPQILPSLPQTVPPPRPFPSDRQSPPPTPQIRVSFHQATPSLLPSTTHCR